MDDDPAERMVRIVVGFALAWLVLDGASSWFGSLRGEAGIAVCGLVLGALVGLEFLLFGRRPAAAWRDLGIVRPDGRALAATLAFTGAMLAFYPLYAAATGTPVTLRADWFILVPGLLAQGGVAEETLFRGFLFRRLRDGRSFRRAATLAAIPFVGVHLFLFASLDFPVALASIALAVSISFPLAWLFERSGNSIWPPAIVHFVVQGSIKLIEAPAADFAVIAAIWIGIAAVAPWAFFLLRPREARQAGRSAAIM